MKRLLPIFLFFSASLIAGDRPLWKRSLVFLATSSSFDLGTSINRPELNPILATNGRFQRRGVAIKLGVTAGFVLTQWWVVKQQPELAKPLAVMNFCIGSTFTAVGTRNLVIR